MKIKSVLVLTVAFIIIATVTACNRSKESTVTTPQVAEQTVTQEPSIETTQENIVIPSQTETNLSATEWVVAEPQNAGDQTWKTANLTATWNRGTLTISGSGAIAGTYFTSEFYTGSYPWKDPHLEVYQLIIGNGITEIGEYAFSGYERTQLTSVIIPDGMVMIWGGAFNHNQLTSITIPDSVTTIGATAFTNNPLTSITIGANVALWEYIDESGPFSAFNEAFDKTYNDGGKQAGTYILNNGVWTKQ